jgi:hypothetical protein
MKQIKIDISDFFLIMLVVAVLATMIGSFWGMSYHKRISQLTAQEQADLDYCNALRTLEKGE